MLQGLNNCLRHLGMIDGAVEKNGPQHFVSNAAWLRASVGGAFWGQAKPMQRVKRGETVALIADLLGRDKERLTAPRDGIVGIRTAATVHSGDCANVSEIDTVEDLTTIQSPPQPSGLLEVLRNRFEAIVNEMGFTLLRTGFTVFIKETGEFSCAW